MARTATTGNALLGLLALRPEWSTWELTNQLRRNMHFFWPRAESRILAELKRLDRDGMVKSRRESVGKRPRTLYSITANGRCHLAGWLETPPRSEGLESEPLLRVMFGDLGSVADMRTALDQVEEDAHSILDVGRVVVDEYADGTAPFQDQVHVRAFVFDYLTERATGLLAWVERTRAELDRWDGLSEDERSARAIKRMVARAKALPPRPS